jgi:hypothetical protein
LNHRDPPCRERPRAPTSCADDARRLGRDHHIGIQTDAIRGELAAELDRHEGAALGFEVDIDHQTGPGALWIHADEYGEPEHVTRFGLRCAEAFDLEGAWSLTCSKPSIEGFGGGGFVLDLRKRETVASIDCADWLAHHVAGPVELAEYRQQEATRENGP